MRADGVCWRFERLGPPASLSFGVSCRRKALRNLATWQPEKGQPIAWFVFIGRNGPGYGLTHFLKPWAIRQPSLRDLSCCGRWFPTLKRWASVPGRGLVYRDERFPTGACDANRSRTARLSPRGDSAKGWKANVRPKEHKWAERQDVGGECASKHKARESLTAPCRAQRRERKEQTLTRGDPGVERLREVSRGHSSV